jgi:hypothetical protein
MPYPGQFHRLVMIGDLYTDQFNMTLSIVPSALGELGMPAVDDATLAAVAGDVSSWFGLAMGSGGCSISASAKLTSIKLNRIGPDGRYVDNESQEYIYPAPVVGNTLNLYPAQLSTVVSLHTARERGRGSKGRVYLPPGNGAIVSSDGRLSATSAASIATGFKTLVTSLNTRYTLIGRVGVASNAGAGRFEHVTELAVGRVPDTMRSRRSKLQEDYQSVAV